MIELDRPEILFPEPLFAIGARHIDPAPDRGNLFPCPGDGMTEIVPMDIVEFNMLAGYSLGRGVVLSERLSSLVQWVPLVVRHGLRFGLVSDPSRPASDHEEIVATHPKRSIDIALVTAGDQAALDHFRGLPGDRIVILEPARDVRLWRIRVNCRLERRDVRPK